jgi:16S rRNA (uracil1498-N3)-methyltransferase
MTRSAPRFFVDDLEVSAIQEVMLKDAGLAHQVGRVLRMQPGDLIIVLDGSGKEFLVEIGMISKQEVQGRLMEQRPGNPEPELFIRLFQAMTKPISKFESILQHGTELGVSEFYPLITERTELRDLRKPERLRAILKEAAEQSERSRIPVLGEMGSLKKIFEKGLSKTLEADLNLFAYERETLVLLSDILSGQKMKPKSVNIWIGPEGGFSPGEVEGALRQGWTIFGLGPHILRTETAGLAVVSALRFGNFSIK